MKKQLLFTLVAFGLLFNTVAQQVLNPGEIIKSYYTTDIFRCRGDIKQNPTAVHATLGVTYDLNEVVPQNFRNLPGKGSGKFSNIRFISGNTARSSKVEIDYTLSYDDLFKESVTIVLDWKRAGTNNTSTVEFVIRYQGPFVYAGKDLYKCSTGEIELNGSYYSEGTTAPLYWSSISAPGNFAGEGSVGAIQPAKYTPNQTDITNGYADIVLYSNESKISCPNDKDTLRVYFELNPTIEVGDTMVDNFNDTRVALTAQPEGELEYKWYLANTTTLLGEGRNYLAYLGDSVRLEVTSDDCSESTGVDLVTASNSAIVDVFDLYPNPVVDYIQLPEVMNWSVLTNTGLVLMKGTGEDVNTESLEAGSYFIQLEKNQLVFTKKFVK